MTGPTLDSVRTSTRGSTYEAVSDESVYKSLNERLIDLAPVPEGGLVLDVGCGTGSLAEAVLSRAPAAAWCIDPDPEMLAVVKERLGSRVGTICSDGEQFANYFPAGVADVVYFGNCIHLVDDAATALRAARHVLRSGGHLAFNTAFYTGAEDIADQKWYWRAMLIARRKLKALEAPFPLRVGARPPAKRPITPDTYGDLLSTVGFKDVSMSTQTVALGHDILRKIVNAPVFAEGAFPDVDPSISAPALAAAVDEIFEANPTLELRRTWLYVTAVK